MTDETMEARFERDLRATLGECAPDDVPASLYAAVAMVPIAGPQGRRGLAFRASRRPYVLLAAAAAIVIVVAAAASGLQPRGDLPAVGGMVTAPPGAGLHLEFDVLPVDRLAPSPADIQRIQDTLGERMRATGLTGFRIGLTTEGGRITVDVPALPDDPAVMSEIRALLSQTGRLDFVPLGENETEVGAAIDLERFPPLFSGDQVMAAAVGTDQTGQRTVDFALAPAGASLFADYTAGHIGESFAIVLDGRAISVPMINGAIPDGKVQISQGGIGGFPEDEAQLLIAILESGALPFPLQEVTPEPEGP